MNEDTNTGTTVGVFEDKEQVDRAVDALRRAGFSDESIGVAMHDDDAVMGDTTVSEVGERITEVPRASVVTGGLIGSLAGAAAVGLIPGIGPVLAAGALVGILGGAAIGSGIGWVAGALTNIGLPEANAHLYAQEFHAGRNLVTVAAGDRQEEARAILAGHGAYDVESTGTGYARANTGHDVGLAGDRTVEEGRTGSPYDAARGTRSMDTTRPVTAADTSRALPQFGRWDDVRSSFREGWGRRHAGTGGSWEEDEIHYRFSWEMSREPQYRDRDWSEVEPELRHRWEMDQPDTPWERAMDSLREAWDEMRDTGSPLEESKEARRREDMAA